VAGGGAGFEQPFEVSQPFSSLLLSSLELSDTKVYEQPFEVSIPNPLGTPLEVSIPNPLGNLELGWAAIRSFPAVGWGLGLSVRGLGFRGWALIWVSGRGRGVWAGTPAVACKPLKGHTSNGLGLGRHGRRRMLDSSLLLYYSQA